MADVVYSVEVQFLQSGGAFNAPASGLQNLKKKTDDWGKSLLGVGSSFANSLGGALDFVGGKALEIGAGMAAAFGVGAVAATKMAFQFNEEMENTGMALAVMAKANGLTETLGDGLRLSSDVLKQMRIDARELPGEFKDLQNIMSQIAGPASHMGLGMHAQEALARDVMMSAAILRVPQEVAGREMAMMLSGNARHNMPLFNKLGFDMSTSEFNKLSESKRLEAIRGRLAAVSTPENRAFAGNTFVGLKTTAMDNIRQAVGIVGAPLFESVKDQLRNFNEWAKNNKSELQGMGEHLAQSIKDAFDAGVRGIMKWGPLVFHFADELHKAVADVWERISPLVEKMMVPIENFLKDPQFEKIIGMVEKFAAVRIGTGAAQLGFKAAGGLGLEGAELAAAAGPVALAIAGLGVAAYGAVDALTDVSAVGHETATGALTGIQFQVKRTGEELEKLGTQLKPVADVMGVTFLLAIQQVITTIGDVVWALGKLKDAIMLPVTLMYKLNPSMLKLNPTVEEPIEHSMMPMMLREMNAKAEPEKERKVPNTNVHVNAKFEIKVVSQSDPERVAKKIDSILRDTYRFPTTAGNTGTPRLTR